MMNSILSDNKSTITAMNASIKPVCKLNLEYKHFEKYYYLYFMCPVAIIGIILGFISVRVFNAKSFNSTVTFKYLRIIARIDLFICIILLPYCLTNYTKSINEYDLYARHFYLAYIYIPLANTAINLSMLFNLSVTLERLISVGWPTKKYTFFKPSRYYLSCILIFILAISFNIINFFFAKIGLCKPLQNSSFMGSSWFSIYSFIKEALVRVIPIIILIIANIALIIIVKNSRNRMKSKSVTKSVEETNTNCCVCWTSTEGNEPTRPEATKSLIKSQANKRNRQDNQLTLMTICVAILYIACSLPMIFVFPGVIFKGKAELESSIYKHLAAICNSLQLFQCSFRFFVYYFFTTQFRLELRKIFGYENKPSEHMMHATIKREHEEITAI